MAGKIFISYRRDDDASGAARIRDALVARFGSRSVFMDVDNLLAGQRFDRKLAQALDECDVLIAVIGPRWMDLLRERAAKEERDYVRAEIAAAIKRDILVVPVRVGHEGRVTSMPRETELPEDIAELALYQKHDVIHERFGADMKALGDAIVAARKAAKAVGGSGKRPWGLIAGGAGAFLIVVAAVTWLAGVSGQGGRYTVPEAPAPSGRFVIEVPPPGEKTAPAGKQAAAELTKPGRRFRDTLKDGSACAFCPEIVVLPTGTFTMGSPYDEKGRSDDEGKQRDVTIGKPIAVGRLEVTRGEYAAFVEATERPDPESCFVWDGSDWQETKRRSWRDPGFAQTDDHPVACISWEDAKSYAKWLVEKTGQAYRLLSEAEWEYAARGQTEPGAYPRFEFGNDEKNLCEYANGADNSVEVKFSDWTTADCSDGYVYTSPAGLKRANTFDLTDMHGNVWEWVEDCYQDSYKDAPKNGGAHSYANCKYRVVRGGSWFFSPNDLRAASRLKLRPVLRLNGTGFRVARTL
jgi:formylglycine-generating enzyme required for sulfatase activity